MFGFKEIDRSNISEFKKNYLRNVVLQVRFDNASDFNKNVELFKEAFKDDFPRFKERNEHTLNVIIGEDETPIIQPSTATNNGFDLRSESGNKLLICNSNAITLNVAGNEYENFKQLNDFIDKLKQLLTSCGLKEISRVSIRKINIIDFNIPDQEELTPYQLMELILNEDLVGKSDIMPDSSMIQQSIQNLIFLDKSGSNRLNLRYGMIRQNPQERRGQILIDIDHIKDSLISVEKIKSELELVNNEIFNIFNWSLSETAYKQLLNED